MKMEISGLYFKMYFPSYNPTLHDLYLYGPGNSGMPIGLNTNCILYDARESYKTIGLRSRRYENGGISWSGQIPPGTPDSELPNYYNCNIPLSWKISPTNFSGCIHYMAGKPSDSLPSLVPSIVKQTGLTANYGWAYWHPNFDGYTYYTEFEGIYNCVSDPPNFAQPQYFAGSPEIPGFQNGATFYYAMEQDFGLMKFRSNSNPPQSSSPFVQSVSILSILKDQNISITDYLNYTTLITHNYTITNLQNLYYIGGSDTVCPITEVSLFIYFDQFAERYPVASFYMTAIGPVNSRFWVGDSSGILVYKKNNKLYNVMHGFGAGFSNNKGNVSGPMHAGTVNIMMDYLTEKTDISPYYFYSLNNDTRPTMNGRLILFQNKVTELINKVSEVQSQL